MAVIQLQQCWGRIARLNLLGAVDEIHLLMPLIAHHPGLQGEVELLKRIVTGYSALTTLTWQDEERDQARKKLGLADHDCHEDVAFRLFTALLKPIFDWPAGKHGDTLLAISAELDGIADLVMHHPHLKTEVEAMRLISNSIDTLSASPVLHWDHHSRQSISERAADADRKEEAR